MEIYEFWRDRSTRHVFAIRLRDGAVTGVCGPLDVSEIEAEFLDALDYETDRAEWLDAHRDEFELYEPTRPFS